MTATTQDMMSVPIPRWHWWKILRANDQNVTADIELARVEVAHLTTQNHDELGRRTLISCQEMLDQCVASHQRILGNRIFVRQTLFLILQNSILITPRENLPAIWMSVKQRLEAVDSSDFNEVKKTNAIRDVDSYLKKVSDGKIAKAQPHGLESEERIVRETIKQIKFSLDAQVVAELWNGMVLQRQLYILGAIAFFSLVATIFVILGETCRLPSGLGFACTEAASQKHGVPATVLAGLLGGALSTISQPMPSSLPLVRVALIRPLIGAIAGLFLFLVSGAEVMKFGYPYLYAAAIAIGFSERAFATLMGQTADEIGKGVARALGHTADKSKGRKG